MVKSMEIYFQFSYFNLNKIPSFLFIMNWNVDKKTCILALYTHNYLIAYIDSWEIMFANEAFFFFFLLYYEDVDTA